MPDPASAYGRLIDLVVASTPSGATDAAFAAVMGAAAVAGRAPIVPFDQDNPGPAARAALHKMQAPAVAAATQARLDAYVEGFGFDRNEPESIRGPSIREPWRGINVADLEAVIAVSRATKVPPAHVLALWIAEGKAAHNQVFRGGALSVDWPAKDFGKASVRQIRAFARSLLLFAVFGADPLIAFNARAADNGDNVPIGPEGPHDARFTQALAVMRAAGLPGFEPANEAITDFFTVAGGGLIASHNKTGLADDTVVIRMGEASLASWLWLQVSLFESVRLKLERGLFDLYHGEGAVNLSARPWVTYLFWNTNKEQRTIVDYYGGFASREIAFSRRFGPDPDHLTANQLDRYYGRGAHAAAAGQPRPQSTAAWANAITVKFLVETVEPWFQ